MVTDNLKLFWYFINERHQIYVKKSSGEHWPWTDDEILRSWKFCNVFRELDRGTVWLREHFREPYKDRMGDLLFNIAWYRLFNWIPTAKAIGWRRTWNQHEIHEILYRMMNAGERVFTNAHMLQGVAGEDKIVTYVRLAGEIWKERDTLYLYAVREKSLKSVFAAMVEFDHIGPFLGYEIVTDLRHTSILSDAKDINSWANVGPGAMRGLDRIFGDDVYRGNALEKMIELHKMHRGYVHTHVPELELRDIEHSLCEFDKFARVQKGEGTPRCRYRPPSGS